MAPLMAGQMPAAVVSPRLSWQLLCTKKKKGGGGPLGSGCMTTLVRPGAYLCSRTPKRTRFVSLSASVGLSTLLAVLFPSPVASLCLSHAWRSIPAPIISSVPVHLFRRGTTVCPAEVAHAAICHSGRATKGNRRGLVV